MELEDDSATKKVVAGLEGRDGVRPHKNATGEAPETRAPAGEKLGVHCGGRGVVPKQLKLC
ncbi:hypothetical protein PanWU01x14_011240 [Parasponia andersonii]|uniref:Uncharacterized protein n=1 Tax=Parasponia andersonii TaxID=3476 RepID=A0A2P5E1F9_PARAD|nr:hypothetical protein PanWU01x14_011240 [Parasponia andersonii]